MRSHDDLDVIIRADDIAQAMQVTCGLEFSLMTDELPPGFMVSDKTDRRIDFRPSDFEAMAAPFSRASAANGCSPYLDCEGLGRSTVDACAASLLKSRP